MNALDVLKERGFIAQVTFEDELYKAFDEGMDAKALLDRCVENNVAYVPGTFFYVEGGHENTMRLNFSNATIEDIDKGMRALGAALAQ